MMKRYLFVFISCVIIITGCGSSKQKPEESQPYETLIFNVDDDLIEPAVVDSLLGISISAPKNWKLVSDSVFIEITTRLDSILGKQIRMEPRQIFVDTNIGAMCVVSKVDSVDISHGEKLLTDLKEAYQTKFPKANVQIGIFLTNEFQINQLMVASSKFVLIKLFLDDDRIPVFEVDYVVPFQAYAQELRSIESSMGSIFVVK